MNLGARAPELSPGEQVVIGVVFLVVGVLLFWKKFHIRVFYGDRDLPWTGVARILVVYFTPVCLILTGLGMVLTQTF